VAAAFITQKEKDNFELFIKLCRDGVINSLGEPFKESNDIEVTNLIRRRVFSFKLFNPDKYKERLFKSRII
jgi:hypothetical protein